MQEAFLKNWEAAAKQENVRLRPKIVEKLSSPSDIWQIQTLQGFGSQLFEEYDQLLTAKHIGSVAFHTRNLLELMIWAIYTMENDIHLRLLYEDAGRDGINLFKAFKEYQDSSGETSQVAKYNDALEKFKTKAAARGIQDIEKKYADVRKLAEKMGQLGSNYSLSHKVLSKCAHPTALMILGMSIPREELADIFRQWAGMYFVTALKLLALRVELPPILEVNKDVTQF